LWWTERNILIRRSMEKHNFPLAYQLAKAHGQSEGQPLAEAEFLAGFLALRFLHQPSEAFEHFHRMYRVSQTPMSRSRGAYWCGRAAEALGDRKQAHEWYGAAIKFPTMYYGQVASVALGGDRPLALPPEPVPSAAEVAEFNRRELVRVVRVLHEIDPRDGADRVGLFLRRLGKDASVGTDYTLLARLADEMRRPDLAIFMAKQAFNTGVVLAVSGYPTVPLRQTSGVESGLLLSLIRQESTFNPNTVSSAGARGLMQLMPATAQLVANKLGVHHNDGRLTAEPDYNILLGGSYIGQMIDNYSGSYIMAIAAYNAGAGRVRDWVAKFGDPRGAGGVDPVDWVELIPIAETRNYVQRVLEALQVYRVRLGQGGGERALGHDLHR
jgi:soluble lytic murein transglycosylase